MITALYRWIVPAEALRWGRLTTVSPWSDAYPAIGERVLPDAVWLWDLAVDPDLPPGIIEFRWPDGRVARYPIAEYDLDERGPFTDENRAAFDLEFDIGSRRPPEGASEDREWRD